MPDNTIEVVLKGVDQMTEPLKQVQQALDTVASAADRSNEALKRGAQAVQTWQQFQSANFGSTYKQFAGEAPQQAFGDTARQVAAEWQASKQALADVAAQVDKTAESIQKLPDLIIRTQQLSSGQNWDPNQSYWAKQREEAEKLEAEIKKFNDEVSRLVQNPNASVQQSLQWGLRQGFTSPQQFQAGLQKLGGAGELLPEDIAAIQLFDSELRKLGIQETTTAQSADALGKKFFQLGSEQIPVARSALVDFAKTQIKQAIDAGIVTIDELEARLRGLNQGKIGARESFTLAYAQAAGGRPDIFGPPGFGGGGGGGGGVPPSPPEVPESVPSSWDRLGLAVIAANQALELVHKTLGPLIGLLQQASDDAGRFELAEVDLASSLELFGKSAPKESLIEFSDEMRKTTGMTREAVLEIESLLVKFSDLGGAADADGKKLKDMTAVILGLAQAEGGGISPEFAARMISNALSNPQQRSIGRSLPQIPLDIETYKRADYMVETYGATIEVAKQKLDTFAGSQKQLGQSVEQVSHTIGEQMNAQLKPWNQALASVVDQINEFLKQNEGLAAGIGTAGNVIKGSLSVLEKLAPTLTALSLLRMSGLIESLTALGVSLTAFAGTPAGLVLMGIAFTGLAAAGIKAGIDMLHAADNARTATDKLGEAQRTLKTLETQLAKTGDENTRKELENSIAKRKAEIDQLKSLVEQEAKPGAAMPRKTREEQELDAIAAQTELSLRKTKEGLKATQLEIAAEEQKILFGATGNIENLLKSFDDANAALRAKAEATIQDKLRQEAIRVFGGTAKERPGEESSVDRLRRMRPDIVANIEAEERAKASLQIEKQRAEQQERLRTARLAAIQAENNLAQSQLNLQAQQVATDQENLKILEAMNAPLEERLKLLQKINAEQIAGALATIALKQREVAQLEERAKGEGGAVRDATLTQVQAAKAEIEKQNLLIATKPRENFLSVMSLLQQAAKNTSDIFGAQISELESIGALEQRRMDMANLQAQVLGKERAPYEQLLDIAQQIDDLEAAKLEKQIEGQRLKISQLQQGNAESGVIAQAQAQLDAFTMQAEFVKTKVLELNASLQQEALNLAEQTSKDFADLFMQGMEDAFQGGTKSMKDFIDKQLIGIGKALTTQLLQEALKSVLEPYYQQQVASGEKAPTTIPGILASFIKGGLTNTGIGDLFGWVKSAPVGAELGINTGRLKGDIGAIAGPMKFEDALKVAADEQKEAAAALKEAAAKLMQALQPSNIQLGPTGQGSEQAQAVEDLADSIKESSAGAGTGIIPTAGGAGMTGGESNITLNGAFGYGQQIAGVGGSLFGGGQQGGGAWGTASGIFGALKQLTDIWPKISSLFTVAPNAATVGSVLGEEAMAGQAPFGAGGGFFSNLWGGISGAASGIWDFITGLFESGGPISSPSRRVRANPFLFIGAPSFAKGGQIPILAHPGEYVMNAAATSSIGLSNLNAMNQGGGLAALLAAALRDTAAGGMNVPPGVLGRMTRRATSDEDFGGGAAITRAPSEHPGAREAPVIHQNLYVVDQRPQGLGPNDVVAIVAADSAKNGKTAKAIQNVIKRSR